MMNPKTVIFYCNWSNYPGLKLSESCIKNGSLNSSQKLMVSMCSGRISPELILEAFQQGAWGVLIAACPKDKCEHDGNYKTCGRIALLKNMLPELGVEADRLKLEWIDKGEVAAFQKAIDGFIAEVKVLGPVPLNM